MSRKGSTTFYSTSPLWSDITPIPLQDAPGSPDNQNAAPALATIAYSPRYAEAMSYLRAVMTQNEYSDRALTLTADIISMNPAHYTVWLYRSRTLRELGDANGPSGYLERVKDELAWLDGGVCARNLKNYQVWHHRQTLVGALSEPPKGEIGFLTGILALDAKNYHVWTYRQWLCMRFPEMLDSSEEMESIETMIEEDVRNNSAWNHRYFLCFGAEDLKSKATGGKGVEIVDEEVVEREVEYAKEKTNLAPQNASSWNYLKGVLKRGGRGLETMQEFCESFVGDDPFRDSVRSSHAVDWLAEIYQKQGEQRRAEQCLDALSKKWDPIRANYWEYRKKQMVSVA